MKITKLKLDNFRQYYDQQTIDFADSDQNVTLIIGANGTGKTGIFRALIYGLYGQKKLEQDATGEKVHLVNLQQLKENQGRPILGSVTLEFENDGNKYVLVRKIAESDQNGEIQELGEEASLTKITENGETKELFTKPETVTDFVSQILPERIRNFFFFDAENLKLLTDLSSGSASSQIKQGVQDILQISTLARGKKILEQLHTAQMKDISAASGDPEIERLTNQIDEDQSKVDELKAQNVIYEQTVVSAEREIQDVNKQLADNQQLQNDKQVVDAQEEIVESAKNSIENNLTNLTSDLEQLSATLVKDMFQRVMPTVKDLREEQRDVFSKQVLVQSLQSGKCMMCGNDLGSNPAAESHVKQLLDNFQNSELSSVLDLIERANDDIEDYDKRLPQKVKTNYKSLIDNSQKAEAAQAVIDRKSQALEESLSLIQNLEDKQKHTLPELKQKKESSSVQILANENSIKQLQQQIDENQTTLNSKIDEQGQLKLQRKVANKTRTILNELSEILNDYDTKARQELSEQVKFMFNQLVTQRDQDLVKEVQISSDYEMQIIGENGVNLLNDISMGQSQVLSLAFIFALAKLASKGRDEIDFPLFVDTPFARLDREIRDNVIQKTPELASQWILLLTNAEYTDFEKSSFAKSNAVGSVFDLKKNSVGQTVIDAGELGPQGGAY